MSVPNLITCEVDGIQYLLHPQILGSTEAPIKADQVIPVLLLTEEELNGTPEQIGQLLQYYVDTDDVCSPSFTDILVEKPSKKSSSLSPSSSKATYRLLQTVAARTSYGTTNPEDDPQDEDDDLPSGPYFLSGPNLHQAYRLYPDTQDAFVHGMIPNDVHNLSTGGFQAVSFLASSSSDSMSKTIPVPSRHYTRFPPASTAQAAAQKQKRPTSPIRGKRTTLTDGLELLGTQTTLACRAFVATYPPATETDAYVQRLLREGAVLVGKTKTSQLRIGNSLWPETHFPANPRGTMRSTGGDFFDCGSGRGAGTGVGSASAVAGYGWLEYAVGGNADSAVRESGNRYGLYGLRRSLTLTAVPDNDKSSPGRDDCVGIFGRSLHDLLIMARCTFPGVDGSGSVKGSSGNTAVKRILYLDYVKDQKLECSMDVFVNALERHLGVDRTIINLDEEWEKYRVKRGLEFSLSETARLLYDLNHYHEYADFRKDYQEKFHSSRGLADLEAQSSWSSARAHEKQHKHLQDQVKTFRDWFEQHILKSKSEDTEEGDTIIVIPDVSFHPKEHITGFFGRMLGFEDMLSSQMATPQLSVPFTQKPGDWLGDEQNYTPVVASVIGPKLTAKTLITLVADALKASGLPTSVQPGPLCFPLPTSTSAYDNDRHPKEPAERKLHDIRVSPEEEGHDNHSTGLNQEPGSTGGSRPDKKDFDDDGETLALAKSSLHIEVDVS
ncbi:amidase signature domain-containing protein [Pseudoneurospora amorphoporcata]|uniref:Amidase signature domain-containing protein n=1 Tax=Pseudoneurospora amorphoporcata TaxID=241081 RepID=A0AAN6SCI3_9PEZI|nr:amidase signature domain-containing protein [Pseudoneurospora amorphoporcata]